MALKASKSWTKQKWRTKSGKPSKKLEKVSSNSRNQGFITPRVLQEQLELKEKAKQRGKQFVKQPKGIAKKTRSYRKVT